MLAGAAAAAPTPARYAGQKLAPLARISLQRARATALSARPGVITSQELEKERGGSGLRYSFDVIGGGRTYEVGVDARSGAVLENDREGKNAD